MSATFYRGTTLHYSMVLMHTNTIERPAEGPTGKVTPPPPNCVSSWLWFNVIIIVFQWWRLSSLEWHSPRSKYWRLFDLLLTLGWLVQALRSLVCICCCSRSGRRSCCRCLTLFSTSKFENSCVLHYRSYLQSHLFALGCVPWTSKEFIIFDWFRQLLRPKFWIVQLFRLQSMPQDRRY